MHDVSQMPHRCTPHFYGERLIDEVNAWCELHCGGTWTMNNYYPGYGATPPTWYFVAREDWMAFILRWTN